MRLSRATKELSVGAVVAVGMIVFAIAVMTISKESRLWVPKVEYWTRFDNTGGLSTGSPVQLVGVQIGTVEEIEFPEDIHESKIKIVMSVDRTYTNRIREGTQAFLKSLSYLSLDKYIELTPGDPGKAALPEDGFIEPGMSVLEETIQRGQSIADDVKEITASLRDLLIAINRGGGIVQEMIHNPEFGRVGVADMEGSVASLRRTLEALEKGQGLAGRLLNDEAFANEQVENIDSALSHVRSVMEKLDSDEGLIHQLSAPDGAGAETVEHLRAAATSLRKTAESLEEEDGLITRLVRDDRYAKRLLEKIEGTAGHAESILRKIDEGEGSIGAIVNDPEVYEGLKDVVAGIRKSRIGKAAIRHYGKKGAKRRMAEQEDQIEETENGGEGEPADTPEQPEDP
jgi:phospholipid/cholesterol/gamma-HCH transport system substrate-binding protein